MSNELVKRDFGLPTNVDSKEYGIDMGEEDVIMPRLQLVQPTSQIDGAGKFYYSLDKTLSDSVDCVIFNNVRGRIMFNPDMSKQESICGSNDRIIPSGRFENPQATKCVECKFNTRGYFEEVIIGKEKIKQECQLTMILRGMFIDNLMPFIFSARRTALFPINEWLSHMQFECARNKIPLCCFPIRLTADLVQRANQKYYVPKIERLPMMERNEFIQMMNKYKDYNPDKTFEQESQSTESMDNEAVPF